MKPFPATWLFGIWQRLRTGFWFLPAIMVAVSIGLLFAAIRLDMAVGSRPEAGWVFSFGPESARAVLSAIATSMITVAGLTFSITMLTLQLASSQFGPRLLRSFMRDRGNQVVLGTFISTFIYCLLGLRTVIDNGEVQFVPHLTVWLAIVFALASIAVLIYFIHHVASSIRIESVLAELAAETQATIDRLYPEKLGHGPPPSAGTDPAQVIPPDFDSNACPICSDAGGYIHQVDVKALIPLAAKHDLIVRIDARPGCFVKQGDPLIAAYPKKLIDGKMADMLRETLIVGQDRTPEQDLEFSLRRIVEIAQRALSPGINDPTTALYCVDRLGEALFKLASRDVPSPLRFDSKGKLRVITEIDTFATLACPALAATARYAAKDADVITSVLATIDMLIRVASPEGRRALMELASDIHGQKNDRATTRREWIIRSASEPGRAAGD